MKKWWALVVGVVSICGSSSETSAQLAAPQVMQPAQAVLSQPMREGHDDPRADGRRVRVHQHLRRRGTNDDHDDTVQVGAGKQNGSATSTSFPGVGANGSAPPDTNMAVGPRHILQTVNSRYAIYDKSGALLVGPNSLSSLWAPLGTSNGCAINDGGDVVAQYDVLAERFIVTQLGGETAPFSECIAISQTSDPTGAYYLYSFSYGSTLNDYPKFGVWPTAHNGAYLATYNLFANGQTLTGGQLCAYDRTKMLAGDPTAQAICFTINGDDGYLPSDLDGSTPPVDGTPGLFLNLETSSSLRLYAFAPNFSNPSASTLSLETPDITVAAFSEACAPTLTCVPQLGTSQQLDSLGDRLMYRLAFRNFGDHESLVVNHSVTAASSVGVRWYELRAPVSASGAFTLFQQGTFAPDATYRWMGSAAMDRVGDIGIGYSASSASIHPAIRYAGRTPADPAGTLETEVSLIEGSGSQTGGLSRWGDYSALRIDPADDCTFWYTNEYLPSNGSFNWSTFFGSFKFPSCGNTQLVPNVVGATQTAATATITAAGFALGTITMSASSTVPAGSVISQNPAAGASAIVGSAINLVVSTGPLGLAVDKAASSDGLGTRTISAFSTVSPGEVLVAFAASDGPSPGAQTLTVSGAGLTWTLVRRANAQPGSSEIWQATSPAVLTNVSITSTQSSAGYAQSLTVVAFTGAGGTGAAVGASASTGAPSISLTTTQPGSFVYGAGNDWDKAVARTPGANQALVHQYLASSGDTMWTQSRTSAIGSAGTSVTINDTAPTTDRWNLVAVEILAVSSSPVVTVPNVVNQTQSAATTAISAAGLVVGTVTTASSTTVPSGSVISQSPTAGTQVAPGSAVSLVVSTGAVQVTVPNVVNQTQSAATTAITAAGLVVGTVTTASSTSVPAGSVMSQNPTAGAQVASGSAVNLVVSSGPPAANPVVDATVSSDGTGTRTTPGFSTSSAGDVLLALAASDGPGGGKQTLTISGAGLTWTLVVRSNTQPGSSEIWRATAAGVLNNVAVQSAQSATGYHQSLTVIAFRGASGVGASASANAANGAPTVTVTTTKSNSLVYGVGNDWDSAAARTPGANQTVVHQWVDTSTGDTYWAQTLNAPVALSGTAVQLNDTAPTADRWNLAAAEIVP